MKLDEIVQKWGGSDGEIDMSEFRAEVTLPPPAEESDPNLHPAHEPHGVADGTQVSSDHR